MRKFTRGYILLTLLVLTGFAGQVSNQTISSKERTLLVNQLKQSKKELLVSVKELTAAQFAFKPAKTEVSIGEKLVLLTRGQADVLKKVESATKGHQRCISSYKIILLANAKTSEASREFFIDELQASQSGLVKYAKTTTEDLHAHQVELANGPMDAYAALLTLPTLTQDCLAHIQELKKHPRFPQ